MYFSVRVVSNINNLISICTYDFNHLQYCYIICACRGTSLPQNLEKEKLTFLSIHWPLFQIHSYIRSSLSYPQFTYCHCKHIFTIDSMSFCPKFVVQFVLIDRSKQINDIWYRRLNSWKRNVRNNPILCHSSLNIQ